MVPHVVIIITTMDQHVFIVLMAIMELTALSPVMQVSMVNYVWTDATVLYLFAIMK